ncbi:DUF397 domain-containing protein [Actinokineospora pegani]|uniref:DUF397 domain-containing protein n=1 Tax=Actinokineospora pegani TaxID=2654637 RepID=UPI001F3D6BF9|nr:DUF397 domain-containing protein [Actinokineospora pegani]
MTTRSEFRQSSFCSNGNCVQVAILGDGSAALRDSKNAAAPAHTISRAGWDQFRASLKSGELAARAV